MSGHIGWTAIIRSVVLLTVLGCAPVTQPLKPEQYPNKGGAGQGYRFENLTGGEGSSQSRDANRLFVCLAFSGGGTRAAALAYGAMIALHQTRIDWPHPNSTLLDEVDCISSVSGGSFTAAYYGLYHDDLFTQFEKRFLYRNVQGRLAFQVALPWNWARLASPYFSRIDLAAETYDDLVFNHARYNDLVEKARRPFIILNATNVATGTRFPFTQSQFDLIGSDLGPVSVARGVAASSAFPFLLSPLTLANHQHLKGFPDLTEYRTGLRDYDLNRSRYFWSQVQLDYVDHPHRYVHLLDGGLADNVGLRSIVNAYQQSNGFISKSKGGIERLAIIAVNARTKFADTISDDRHTPHIIPTVALATATISMDNYSFDSVDEVSHMMDDLRKAKLVNATCPGQPAFRAPVPYVSEISFEAITDPRVREAYYGISTSFALPAEQVQALIYTGCELIKQDRAFRCLVEDIEREAAGRHAEGSACDQGDAQISPHAVEQIVCPSAGTWPKL